MKKKSNLIILFLFSLFFFCDSKTDYWLVIGTYRQGPGSRPEVMALRVPLYLYTNEDLDTCKRAGGKIADEIYKPVWQFDSKWTCVFSGDIK